MRWVGPKRRLSVEELMLWIVVLKRLLRVLWTARRSKQSVLKEIKQSVLFIGRTVAEAETPILWPPDVKSQLIEKDSDFGEDWKKEEKGAAEGEMVGWHHQLNGHEFEQTLGNSEGQGSLVCCSPWGHKVEPLNSGKHFQGFSPSCALPFHFLNSVYWIAEALNFDAVPFIDLSFYRLCL